jgi:thiosulfate reductase cytochrome b subunit
MQLKLEAKTTGASETKRLKAKHSLAIRWFHWINFPVLFIMIWSGILIYWANDVYRLGWGERTLFKFFPPGFYHPGMVEGATKDASWYRLDQRLAEGMAWHFALAWIFTINGLLYVLYVAFSGEWRHLLPNRNTLKEALHVVLHDLRIRRQPLPRAKFNGAQRIAYTSVILMGLGSLVTGLAIYKPVQLAWISSPLGRLGEASGFNASGYEVARWLHFWLTIGFVLFFLIHVAQVVRAGWNNFRAMITGYEIVSDEADTTSTRP